MLERRLDNTIFIMYLVTQYYCKERNLTTEQFLELDKKYSILNYVSECPDVFDSMTDYEMVEEVDGYISQF